ncbi:hypothetical protein F511_10108 [Dorcoceras hygrometricum]|uniref:Uncharacterized protein n=1 Tax=Dorcoceras hygrometricum TaxID=472368 RepID=A0A2Z7A4W3_9LAMI|nr:hypothetical protein F511_10108 [Dorcoceras hygrometricum]
MKITLDRARFQETQFPKATLNSPHPSDLSHKSSFSRNRPRRRIKNSGVGVFVKRGVGTPSAIRGCHPETPTRRWKLGAINGENNSVVEEESSLNAVRRGCRNVKAAVSARKLAAVLWGLHLPGFPSHAGHDLGVQFDLSSQFPNSPTEGVTKWDPVGLKRSNHIDQREISGLLISDLERELEHARARISELETERRSSEKKLEQFLLKLREERAAWRSRIHEKIRVSLHDMKAELSNEKKTRQRLEMVNSKLVNQLSEAKLSAKHYMQESEKERKARELIEEVCDELANEIGDDRDEAEAAKRESIKVQEDVEEERRMLQMAEVWREERVQMKLVDAKIMLEEKYLQMNKLVADLQTLLNSRSAIFDMEEIKKAELLCQASGSVNIQDVRDLRYEPPNSGDFFSVSEDSIGESNKMEAEPCLGSGPCDDSQIHIVSPGVGLLVNDGACALSNAFISQSGELEEDTSEWETASHVEDQGSSYSPDGSDPSVSRHFQDGNLPGSGEETIIMDLGEVALVPTRNSKKALSISRLWRSHQSNNSDSCKILSADGKKVRPSNGATTSPDHLSPSDLAEQVGSPVTGNPQATQGRKGCIEWPLGAQKGSLKARLLEARMLNQNSPSRQVSKPKT